MPVKTNGKTIKVNINQMVYKELHRPMVTDKNLGKNIPVYSKLDSYKRSRDETIEEGSQVYKAKEKTHFNSANNIRKVFITHSRIYIEYYTSPGIQGHNIPTSTQAKLDTDIATVIPNILNYEQMMSRYIGELSLNPKAKGPDNYMLEGNILGVFNQRYTCSNIEEIYFDWTMLFTDEVQTFLRNNGFESLTNKQAIQGFISGSTGIGVVQSDIWVKMFANFAFNAGERPRLAKDANYFRVKYPRLKIIAMVDILDDILDSTLKGRSLIQEVKNKECKTWIELNADTIKNVASAVIISKAPGQVKMDSFVTQEDMYIFDKQFKTGWLEVYKSTLNDIIRQSKYGGDTTSNEEQDTVEEETEINEVELRLLEMEQELDTRKFNQVLNATVKSGFKVNELKSLFRSFSKPNRARWAKVVGLTLD